MNWHFKALVQRVFSRIPCGETLNYLMQRFVTKSLPMSCADFPQAVSMALHHLGWVRPRLSRRRADLVFYEFGAGQTLMMPLIFWSLGVERQILVDIRPIVRVNLVNDSVRKLQTVSLDIAIERIPSWSFTDKREFRSQLLGRYGIDYHAPCDASATRLESNSIDCITSTGVLEHIPSKDIPVILAECRRILRGDGLISFYVDYQDHYCYSDKSVSPYNFLQYSDKSWRRFNSSLHYQNRLRHPDYLGLYARAGFQIVAEELAVGSEADFSRLKLSQEFRHYELRELAVRRSWILLRKIL